MRSSPDEAQTVARSDIARTPISYGTGPSIEGLSVEGTHLSVVQALVDEEAARASGFGIVLAFITGAALVFAPFLAGTMWLQMTFAFFLALLFGVSVWVAVIATREGRWTKPLFRLFGCTAVATSIAVEYYVGVFSCASLAVTLGISFFGLGVDRKWAIGICSAATIAYVALATSIIAGVVPDLGLFAADDVSLIARIFVACMVPLIYAGTLWQARMSRNATYEAMEKTNRALLLAQQRGARLDEARAELEDALRVGPGEGRYADTRLGSYQLEQLIGRGAMGEIYRAKGDDGAFVAVKILTTRDDVLVQRFLREGELASKVDVPQVVKTFEHGRTPHGAPYLVMELLDGPDLAAMLRKVERLNFSSVTELLQQLAIGLDAAHAAGVVHRDLKPQNLVRVRTPEGAVLWKVVDFGVARLATAHGTLTEVASVIGTPGYMSPEQAKSKVADHRADVFSLTAVAYRALTGQPPFAGETTAQSLFEVVYRSPVRPSLLVDDLPRAVETVLAIGMAKNAADRFGSAGELAAAFASALEGQEEPSLGKRARGLLRAHPWRTIEREV